jgi:ABC-type transport system involved in cytochrome c biogenesis permease subunit
MNNQSAILVGMHRNLTNLRADTMPSRYKPWKIAFALVVYVALCMLVLVFAPPDYAKRNELVQTSAPETSVTSVTSERT